MKGIGDLGEEKNIDHIAPYFGKYTLDGLNNILNLRLRELKLNDVTTLQGIFLGKEKNNIVDIINYISSAKKGITLVPLNLYNKHAVGLIFEKNENGIIQVKYCDSLNAHIPQELEELITSALSAQVNFSEITVERQKYANCGPEVIENFILCLISERVSQERSVELHSKLIERELMSSNQLGTYFLLENVCVSMNSGNYEHQVDSNNIGFHDLYNFYQSSILGVLSNEIARYDIESFDYA